MKLAMTNFCNEHMNEVEQETNFVSSELCLIGMKRFQTPHNCPPDIAQ